MFDILIVFLEEFLKKAHLEKSADDKKQEKDSTSLKNISGLNGQAVADPEGVQCVSLEPSSLPPVLKYRDQIISFSWDI